MANKLFLVGIALTTFVIGLYGLASTTRQTEPTALEDVDLATMLPYLEAKIIVREKLGLWVCGPEDNFGQLPTKGVARDELREALASYTMALFRDAEQRVSRYIPMEELDTYLGRFAVGDSPWGLLQDPRIRPVLTEYLARAKTDVISYRAGEKG
jgi:hypothetical protein